MTNFTSAEEYAHQSITEDQCFFASFMILIPFVYLIIWQIHFAIVVRCAYEEGKIHDEQLKIASWRKATSEMHKAGLSRTHIDNPMQLRQAAEVA